MKLSLDERLLQAEERRQSFLDSIRLKASTTTKRKERIDQFQAMQYLGDHARRAQSDARLSGASERKKERERERAAAAGRHCQMVIERVEEMKERERLEAAERRERCDERLKEAARRRARSRDEDGPSLSPSPTGRSGFQMLEDVVGEKRGDVSGSKVANDGNTERGGKVTSSSSPSRQVARQPMEYDRAVNVLRDCGIHSLRGSTDAKSIPGLPRGQTAASAVDTSIHPPPINHSSVTMPFDRFAELIADSQVLIATQRVLTELLRADVSAKINARVFLSAYMIVNYPEVVLSGGTGSAASIASISSEVTQEARLTEAAGRMIASFGAEIFGDGNQDGPEEADFSARYVEYQEQFAIWKSHDASGLENDLIKAAVELESSRLVKLGELSERIGVSGIGVRHQVDIDALVEGVDHDLELIQERVASLTGMPGVARLKAALEAVKTAHEQAQLIRERERNGDEVYGSPGSLGSGSLAASPLKTSPLRKMSRREMDVGKDLGVKASASGSRETNTVNRAHNLNLNLMWGLLYDPSWRIPTRVLELQWKEALGDAINMSVVSDDDARSLALERRVWEELQGSLLTDAGSSDEKVLAVVKVLDEIVSKLGEHIRHHGENASDHSGPGSSLEHHVLEIQESLLPKASESFWMDVHSFLEAIEWCSDLVLRLCAPARDADIRRAQRIVGERFQEVIFKPTEVDHEKAVSGIVQSLRVLHLQARILSMDVANAHLEALTSAMSMASLPLRIQYARSKLAEELGVPMDSRIHDVEADTSFPIDTDEFKSSLGNTRGWIAVASGRLPRLKTALNSPDGGNYSKLSQSDDGNRSFPVQMRTGTMRSASSRSVNSEALHQTPIIEPINVIGCWRGLVRVGLVHLISGDGAIGSMSLPETLTRDVPRLFSLQNDFQKCTILAICMAVIEDASTSSEWSMSSSTKPSSTSVVSPVVVASGKRDAKTRIKAILGDPEVTLEHVATEVSSCMMALNPSLECLETVQAHVLQILRKLVHRSSMEGRVLIEHLVNMLVSVLVSGNDASYVYNTCGKIGAAEIADDIFDLGRRIGEVAAVSEAVCGPWYAVISAEFIN